MYGAADNGNNQPESHYSGSLCECLSCSGGYFPAQEQQRLLPTRSVFSEVSSSSRFPQFHKTRHENNLFLPPVTNPFDSNERLRKQYPFIAKENHLEKSIAHKKARPHLHCFDTIEGIRKPYPYGNDENYLENSHLHSRSYLNVLDSNERLKRQYLQNERDKCMVYSQQYPPSRLNFNYFGGEEIDDNCDVDDDIFGAKHVMEKRLTSPARKTLNTKNQSAYQTNYYKYYQTNNENELENSHFITKEKRKNPSRNCSLKYSISPEINVEGTPDINVTNPVLKKNETFSYKKRKLDQETDSIFRNNKKTAREINLTTCAGQASNICTIQDSDSEEIKENSVDGIWGSLDLNFKGATNTNTGSASEAMVQKPKYAFTKKRKSPAVKANFNKTIRPSLNTTSRHSKNNKEESDDSVDEISGSLELNCKENINEAVNVKESANNRNLIQNFEDSPDKKRSSSRKKIDCNTNVETTLNTKRRQQKTVKDSDAMLDKEICCTTNKLPAKKGTGFQMSEVFEKMAFHEQEPGIISTCAVARGDVSCGYIHVQQNTRFNPDTTLSTVFLVLKGKVDVSLKKKKYTADTGSFLYFPKGVPYSLVNKSSQEARLSYFKKCC